MVDQIINGYVRNPIKDGAGEIPGTTGELYPATRQLTPAKMTVRLAPNFAYNPALSDACAELYTKVRSKVSGRRTYTADTVTKIIGNHFVAYSWYLCQLTLLNAYASAGKIRVASPEKLIAQYKYDAATKDGIGYATVDNDSSILYSTDLQQIRDKLAELGRLLDVCIVPSGLKELAERLCYKHLLTTKDIEAPEAIVQVRMYHDIMQAVSFSEFVTYVNEYKDKVLRISGIDPADIAQFVSDCKVAGISTAEAKPFSDNPKDAFKYDPEAFEAISNMTYAFSTEEGIMVTDFSYNIIYAEPMVYFYGDYNKLLTICGIVFDSEDKGNGNQFPNHTISCNALFTIADARFFRWWNIAADHLGITDIPNGSMSCYINTAGVGEGAESYEVQAFINLMLMQNGRLDGLLPTISVQDPGALDPDHWALLPMRTNADPHCWAAQKINSKQHELIQMAVIGNMTLGKNERRKVK